MHARTRSISDLSAVFAPSSVAIVGASPRSHYCSVLSANLARFAGSVDYVNSRYDEVHGQPCYRSLSALPSSPDHVLVITPAAAVPKVVREAAEIGVRAVTIYSSGYGESARKEGRALDAELRQLVGDTGILLCGPNCMGIVSSEHSFCAYTAPLLGHISPGPLSVVSHSGGLLVHWLPSVYERGIGIRHAVSSGNEIGLTTPEYLEYFVDDPGTRVIALLYLEAAGDGVRFVRALRRALEAGKPVIAVKVGRTDATRTASLTHTGRLGPSGADFEAVARSCGVATFSAADEVAEAILAFLAEPLPAGGRAAVAACSGALATHMADVIHEGGGELSLAALASETLAEIDGQAPGWLQAANPLDAGWPGQSDSSIYLRLAQLMLSDPGVDLLLMEGDVDRATGFRTRLRDDAGLGELRSRGKPVYFYSRVLYTPSEEAVARADRLGLTYLQGTSRAAQAIESVLQWQRVRRRSELAPEAQAKPWRWPRAVRHDQLIDAFEGYGLVVAPGSVVASADDAVLAADRLGLPVALKRLDFVHKSDEGAVRLGLASARELREAYSDLAALSGPSEPVLYAQQMVEGDWSLLFGGRASDFGAVVMVGMGGVLVEALDDVSLRLAPVDVETATEMLSELRAWSALKHGRRRQPAADIAWVATALSRFSQLVQDACAAGVAAIEANPIIVGTQGTGGVAVDLRAELRG